MEDLDPPGGPLIMGELTRPFPFGEAPDEDPGPLGPLHAPRLIISLDYTTEGVLTYLGEESPPLPPPRPPRPLPLREAISIQVQ
jgi:hypothetical protein